jgi:cellulose synthase/poly-beta-1,6-N-acetylglucosamine synthase-like glycosyltransferase
MQSVAHSLAWIAAGLVLGQTVLLAGYARFLFRFRRRPALEDEQCPRAAVVLCVRGLDPFLPACLKGIFQQDYPDYDVWIVVDSIRDPAWPVIQKLVQKAGRTNIHVLTLTERLTTCTRKLAGILQAVSNFDESREIVAFLDSDVTPHPSWLRELAAPLQDPRVGVASGNRWYMPARPTVGSLVRYLWNVAAVVQMYWYSIGWGGSLAIKMKFLRQSDLRQRLANGFSDDTTICRCARDHGFQVAFSPSLVMVNREECSVKGIRGFLERQLLAVRLHNRWWPAIVGHGILTTAAFAAASLLGVLGVAMANWNIALWGGATLAAYWASMLCMLLPLEWCVRRVVRARGDGLARFGIKGWLLAMLLIPLAQLVHFRAMCVALFAHNHRWRGVQYQFTGLSTVRVRVIEDLAEAA